MKLGMIAGIENVEPLSLRHLAELALAKLKIEWDHTAEMLVMMANVNRDSKTRPFEVEEAHPYRSKSDYHQESPIDVLKLLLGPMNGEG